MSADPAPIKGLIRNGVIVLDTPYLLPDGTEVEVTVTRHVFTAEEQAEFDMWDRLSEEAWTMIDDWENESTDERYYLSE